MVVVVLPLFFGFFGYEANAQLPSQIQSQVANCTVTSASWTTNNEGQSPCEVGTALINACTPLSLSVLQPLSSTTDSYRPPILSEANDCLCSSVTYAMVSACAVCQGSPPGPWSQGGTDAWIFNCPAKDVNLGSYPNAVPADIFIPTWAFQNITAVGDTFNPSLAEQDSMMHPPDVTTGTDPVPATNSPASSTSPGAAVPSMSSSSSAPGQTAPPAAHQKSNGGVIAGAVVGSLAGVVCIALAVYFYIRYRKERTPRRYFEEHFDEKKGTSLLDVKNGTNGQSSTVLPTVQYPPLKLYDPEDPTTFPTEPMPIPAVAPASPSVVSTTFTHSRNPSEDTTVSRTGLTHSRQSSDTTSFLSSTLTATTTTVARNNNTGYNPSGIVYRGIPEVPE